METLSGLAILVATVFFFGLARLRYRNAETRGGRSSDGGAVAAALLITIGVAIGSAMVIDHAAAVYALTLSVVAAHGATIGYAAAIIAAVFIGARALRASRRRSFHA